MQLFQQQYRIIGSFGASMRNIRDSLAKMAGGMLPVIDTEVAARRLRARPRAARKPAGVRQDRRARSDAADDRALDADSARLRHASTRCARRWPHRRRCCATLAADRPHDAWPTSPPASCARVGPRLRSTASARDNLAAAFPEKSPAEIEAILRGVWDNLGRVAAEFAHIDRAAGSTIRRSAGTAATSTPTQATFDRFHQLRDDGKPALIFAAHLANWELPALVAAAYGLDTIVLYRRPNIGAVADAVIAHRAPAAWAR